MPGQVALVIRTADGEVKNHLLAAGAYVLGREADCDVVIESADVSRHHARLILGEQDFQIVDLGSTLGTKLNGQALRGPQRAKYPAMLQLGSVNISVKLGSGEMEFSRTVEDAVPLAANPDAGVPYVFRSEIARGGMGSILEAEDCKLGRSVAVKIMLSELNVDEGQKQRFINEAAVLARLEHPNIVPIHDIGRDSEGQLYYSMKLVHGRTLQAILNGLREGEAVMAKEYTLDRLLTIFRKVCDAMAFAHSRGIIHRDLKPENVMVGEFGEVLVMDWGLAKALTDRSGATVERRRQARSEPTVTNFGMTMDGDVMGTPQYMSPEQAEGRVADLDSRSDIFSLGGILYCILTLRPPVEGTTLEEVLQKVAQGRITAPSAQNATSTQGTVAQKGKVLEARKIKPLPHCPGGRVPAALSAVAMKALTVDRAKRYQKVPAFAGDVEAYQGGFATSAEQAGAWKQFMLLVKRHKAAALGVAAALVIGGAFGARAVIEGQRANVALASLKKTAPTMLSLAESEAGFQRFDSALEKITAALALDPTLVEAQWQRAWMLLGKGQWKEAVAQLQRAQKEDPAHADRAAILPQMEQLAAKDDSKRAGSKEARAIVSKLESLDASGPATALIARLKLGHDAALAAVRERLTQWLGPAAASRISYDYLGYPGLCANLDKLEASSLEPLAGQPIENLVLDHSKISSLEGVQGMPLRRLSIVETSISDLRPLSGLPLHSLYLRLSKVTDLRPLRGMSLNYLSIDNDGVADLSGMRGLVVRNFSCTGDRVQDLSPLVGMPLTTLNVRSTDVSDLSVLKGMALQTLDISGTRVRDLTPLRGMRLQQLWLGGCPASMDLGVLLELGDLERLEVQEGNPSLPKLRLHPSLRFISLWTTGMHTSNFQPVDQFWKEYDARSGAGGK